MRPRKRRPSIGAGREASIDNRHGPPAWATREMRALSCREHAEDHAPQRINRARADWQAKSSARTGVHASCCAAGLPCRAHETHLRRLTPVLDRKPSSCTRRRHPSRRRLASLRSNGCQRPGHRRRSKMPLELIGTMLGPRPEPSGRVSGHQDEVGRPRRRASYNTKVTPVKR